MLIYIASEWSVGYKHNCPVTLSGDNSFAISQSWFTNDKNVCKLCKCHCCFFLSTGYFPFVPSHSWLIVTIQSGRFTLNYPHVIRVSSTVILNILPVMLYMHSFTACDLWCIIISHTLPEYLITWKPRYASTFLFFYFLSTSWPCFHQGKIQIQK